MNKRVQIPDRHERGGLPDTVRFKPSRTTRRLIKGWQFWPSADARADIIEDEDGHVTVICHCPRCEVERSLPTPDIVSRYIRTHSEAGQRMAKMAERTAARSVQK